MRIGLTIIFNGLHHLLHNDYAVKLANILDYWIIVEGAAGNTGSTKWCKKIPDKYHNNGNSVDGTVDFLKKLKGVKIIFANGIWKSKDEMVNRAIKEIKQNKAFLWQIDIDEQWTAKQIGEAEKNLNGDTGMFLCDYYVGKNLIAKGEWGEGKKLPYRRLWKWRGQSFASHEPPILKGGNGKEVLLKQRFKHYAYYFPQDVKFKENYYTGHRNIYQRWLDLQKETKFPQSISRLISGSWGKTKTEVIKCQ